MVEVVRELLPLPDETIRRKIYNTFDPIDYERNIAYLRSWLEKETETQCNDNLENHLHVILRGAKNNLPKAERRLRNYLSYKAKWQEFYQFHDLDGKFEQYQQFYCLCQPYVSPEGFRTLLLGFTAHHINDFDVETMFQTLQMIDRIGMCLAHPYCLGFNVVMDLKHVGTWHALRIISWRFRRHLRYVHEVMPHRLPRIFIVNVPAYVERFVAFGKAFLSQKLRSRLIVEHSDVEMKKHIPLEALPEDYGGLGESIATQCSRWFDVIRRLRPWFEDDALVLLKQQ